MSEQPPGQNEDTKYTKNNSKHNIEQREQVGKPDTAEGESVESGRGSTTRGVKASGGTSGL